MWANDTIAALSTPAGASAAAIVRLSGPEALAIVGRLAEGACDDLSHPSSYSVREAKLRLGATGPRCPATLYLMPGPRSYTREDVAEMHVIGSPPVVRMLLDACLERGARLAEPGEFTRRAFLAGRLTLAQAEGVLAAIQAESAGELRAAMRVLDGEPSRHIRELHDRLVALRAQVEASIDFAQHDIELVERNELLAATRQGLRTVDRELANADTGALPPEGVRVALCGLPNAGKSSLFNALLDRRRTIVTEVPGTTRDAVAEPLVLGGVRFRLYDTAGLFETASSQVEERGEAPDFGVPGLDVLGQAQDVDTDAVARARGLIAGTQIALVVLDGSRPLGEAERRLWESVDAPQKLLLLSKSDVPSAIGDHEAEALAGGGRVLRTSAKTGHGLREVRGALVTAVRTGRVDASPGDLVWNARHRQAFRQAREALRRARRATEEDLGAEFIAADLREAHNAVGAVTGDVVAEDILDAIFAEFCIGK